MRNEIMTVRDDGRTTQALLVCEGRCKEPTRHTLVEQRKKGDVYKQMYECSVCHIKRVWGAHAVPMKTVH